MIEYEFKHVRIPIDTGFVYDGYKSRDADYVGV